jgi:hypothetical protein
VARTLEDFIRRYRRELGLVAVVLAAQVWLLMGCGVVVGRSNWWQVALALGLVSAVSVMVWLGFVQRSYSKRLLIAALSVFIVAGFAGAAVLAEMPVAVVCW